MLARLKARARRFGAGAGKLLKDLFYGVGNQHLDLARCIAAVFAAIAVFAVLWNAVHLGKEIDLAALLGGLTALAGGIGGLIAAKDWIRSKFTQSETPAPPEQGGGE